MLSLRRAGRITTRQPLILQQQLRLASGWARDPSRHRGRGEEGERDYSRNSSRDYVENRQPSYGYTNRQAIPQQHRQPQQGDQPQYATRRASRDRQQPEHRGYDNTFGRSSNPAAHRSNNNNYSRSAQAPPAHVRARAANQPIEFENYDKDDLVSDVIRLSADPNGGNASILYEIRNSDKEVQAVMLDQVLSVDGAVVHMACDRLSSKVITSLVARARESQRKSVADQLSGNLDKLWSSKTGSIFLRSSLEVLDRNLSKDLLAELLDDSNQTAACASDQFGTYVIEHVLKFGGNNERSAITRALKGHLVKLAKGETGNFVVSTMLSELDAYDRKAVVTELLADGNDVVACMQDKRASFVIKKLLDKGTPEDRAAVVKSLKGKMPIFARGRQASTVAVSVLVSIGVEHRGPLVDEIVESSESLMETVCDAGGIFVINFLFEQGSTEERAKIATALKGHVSELRESVNGALFLRRVMEEKSDNGKERDMLICELLSDSSEWIYGAAEDPTNKYLVPHLLDFGTSEERDKVLEALQGRVVDLATHDKGFAVVRNALKVPDESFQRSIVSELLASPDAVLKLATCKRGEPMILEIISRRDPVYLSTFLKAAEGNLLQMSENQFGSVVVQAVLRAMDESARDELIMGDKFLADPEKVLSCSQHSSGSFLIQYLLTECSDVVCARVCESLQGRWVEMAMDKIGCFVVQCALKTPDEKTRDMIVNELLESNETLLACGRHESANFVIRKLLETGTAAHCERAIDGLLHGDVFELSKDEAGKFIVVAALDNASTEQRNALVQQLMVSIEGVNELTKDRQGNMVIRHILEFGSRVEHDSVMESFEGYAVDLATHGVGNHTLMFALETASREKREALSAEILNSRENMKSCVSNAHGKVVVRMLQDIMPMN